MSGTATNALFDVARINELYLGSANGNLGTFFDPNNLYADNFKMRGFDRLNPETMGDPSADEPTRTFSYAVKSGQSSFHFWAGGRRFTKTTTQTVQWADTTGTYYFYFDTNGVLQSVANASMSSAIFLTSAICGLGYYNKENNTFWLANDEAHGIIMDAATHFRMHLCEGFKYAQGGEITGLADASDDYTSIGTAVHFDEDILLVSIESTAHKFMYRNGTEGGWILTSTANDKVAHMGTTRSYWNEYTGGAWQLTETGNTTDYVIGYFLKTNLSGDAGLVKLIGQQVYANRSAARDALMNQLKTIKLAGLSSSEAEFQFAYIYKRNGTLEDDGNGNAYVDLRGSNINSLN